VKALDDLIAEIVVDCYDDDVCIVAFCTALGTRFRAPVK